VQGLLALVPCSCPVDVASYSLPSLVKAITSIKLRLPLNRHLNFLRINPAPRDEGTSRTVAEACIRGIQVTLGTLLFSAFVTIGSHGNKLLHQ